VDQKKTEPVLPVIEDWIDKKLEGETLKVVRIK
jgi:hypothetical protein